MRSVSVSVPDALARRLDNFASSSDLTTSAVVRRALDSFLDSEDARMRETLEAVESVRAGAPTVSFDAVSAWIDSLDTESELPLPGA